MTKEELSITNLLKNGFMEKVPDFEYEGVVYPTSVLLGFRITPKFVRHYFARVFD